jgi:UDP-glucose 4-epimerase
LEFINLKKQILVTGGTGYIGSHTTVELIEENFDPVIVDNLSNSKIEVLDGIEEITGIYPDFEKFDLCNKDELFGFFRKYPNIEAIIHFAASKAVGESVEKPLLYYSNNLVSLINLLEAMSFFNIPYMVFSSSCTVYGQPDELPVTEKAPFKKAFSPYGNTKQISEEILQDTISANPFIKAISLRYFNPIGAHPSSLIGEMPLNIPDNLVPFITQTAIGIRDYLRVFGNDYNTPDGSCIRDYIHVVDLSKAHVVAIKRLLEKNNKSNHEIFNLGMGGGVSVFEVIKSFEKASGQKIKYKIVNRRPGDIEQVWADTEYANEELGWIAEFSLEDAMLSAWNWEKHYRQKWNIK